MFWSFRQAVRIMIPWPERSFFLTVLLTLISFSVGRDTLTQTQPLADNETLLSSSGNFALGFFTPTDSESNNRYLGLWYKKIADQTIVWVANRNNPVVGSKGTLWITADGTLAITNQNSTLIWSANITGITDPVAQLLDTGNLVVKQSSDSGDRYAWQSFDYPTDTLIPGMKLGVDHTTGIIRNLTAWTSYNDPSPGAYNLVMDINGVPEMYFCQGSTKVWRSGPLTGIQFNEMQDVVSKYGLTFSFVDNDEEQTFFYNITNQSIFSRLVVNFTGYVQQSLWLKDSRQWLFPWTAPKDQCDQIGTCGPYGVCDPATSFSCQCLQGFMPNDQPNWFLRDARAGCIRKVTLDCWNGTDGFATVSRVKLPDTSNHTVYMTLSLNECRAMCLNNCSCTAYASANVSGGRLGCFIWATEQLYDIKLYDEAGQDLYLRLASADLVSTPGNSPASTSGNSLDITPGEISH